MITQSACQQTSGGIGGVGTVQQFAEPPSASPYCTVTRPTFVKILLTIGAFSPCLYQFVAPGIGLPGGNKPETSETNHPDRTTCAKPLGQNHLGRTTWAELLGQGRITDLVAGIPSEENEQPDSRGERHDSADQARGGRLQYSRDHNRFPVFASALFLRHGPYDRVRSKLVLVQCRDYFVMYAVHCIL
jgi:hypothetical protein